MIEFETNPSTGEVGWENQGTTTAPRPKIDSIKIINKTETSIKVQVITKRNVGGTLIYSIQKENGSYQEVERVTQTATGDPAQEEYTFNNLDSSKIYSKIKVEAIAENGETASKEIDVVSIPELTRNDVTFTYTVNGKSIKEGDYTKGPVMVKIMTKNVDTTEYKLQYATEEPEIASNWKDYDNRIGVEFTNNGNLYVRLGDGRQGGKYTTESVTNIDRLAPKQFTPTATSEIDSITITGSTTDQEVTATDASSGIDKYYFSISKEGDNTWKAEQEVKAVEGKEATYTFGDLMPDNTFNLKMKAVDKAGNEITTGTLEQKTAKLEIGFDYSTDWTNDHVVVSIKTNPQNLIESGYTIEYSKEGNNWVPYPTTGINIEENGSIQVQVKNAKGKVLGNATTNIRNIDKTTPDNATITVYTGEGITAKVEQSDKIDNDKNGEVDLEKCKWVYSTNSNEIGTDETKYTGGTFTANPQTITLNYQNEGTYYLHVLTVDKAGNKKETISKSIFDNQANRNRPNLQEGMTAVYWDDTNGENEKILTAQSSKEEWSNWYNYVIGDNVVDTKTSKWANAKITKEGVDSYFVWIPRYEYKIVSGEGTNTPGPIEVKFIPTSQTTPDEGYKIHPAFTNGTANNFKNGEWDKEIPGIWVGKCLSSHSDATTDTVGSSNTLKIMPGIQNWRNITVGDCYMIAYNYDRAKESHLIKNSEWGAVAYLSHSQYGRNGQRIDGSAGVQASTTGNVYGIYDFQSKYTSNVAAYISNGYQSVLNGSLFISDTTLNANGYQNLSTKYVTVYPFDSSNDTPLANVNFYRSLNYGYGDAILETSQASTNNNTSSWSGSTWFPCTWKPFMVRYSSFGFLRIGSEEDISDSGFFVTIPGV